MSVLGKAYKFRLLRCTFIGSLVMMMGASFVPVNTVRSQRAVEKASPTPEVKVPETVIPVDTAMENMLKRIEDKTEKVNDNTAIISHKSQAIERQVDRIKKQITKPDCSNCPVEVEVIVVSDSSSAQKPKKQNIFRKFGSLFKSNK